MSPRKNHTNKSILDNNQNDNRMIGIYIRVSTLEQAKEGYSIAAQKERLIAHCSIQGWDNYKLFVDEGVSAKDTNRPQLQELLNQVEQGKVSTILVYRLDRFTRRVKDLHRMLEFLEDHNCAFQSATEPYDTSTGIGKLFITIVAALAEWEADNLSERVKMALEEKVSSGERVGAVPYGFDLTEDEKLIKNDKAAVVLDMVNKVRSGMSTNQVAEYLNKTNDDKDEWRVNTILRLLRNPALYGATRWNDKVYENTHEGIISKSDFDQLQQVLQDRATHRRREVKSNYLFQGVLTCPGCSRPLSVNRHIRKRKDGSDFQFSVYRCQMCRKEGKETKTIGEYRFEEALKVYMQEYLYHIEFEINDPVVEEKDESELYKKQLKQVEKQREKYQRAWSKDLISDDEFEERMAETKDIYDDLKKKIKEAQPEEKIDLEAIKEMVLTFNKGFSYLTQEEKRDFIAQFIRKIDYKLIPQPPKRPDKHKKGKDLVVITNVEFY